MKCQGVGERNTDMNAQRKSPKLSIAAALMLAAIYIGAASVSAVRDRVLLHAGDPTCARLAHVTGDGESVNVHLKSLVMRGSDLRDAGRYKEAEPLLREALALAEETFGSDSFETATVLNQLGMVGKYHGHFDEAEVAYRRALSIA